MRRRPAGSPVKIFGGRPPPGAPGWAAREPEWEAGGRVDCWPLTFPHFYSFDWDTTARAFYNPPATNLGIPKYINRLSVTVSYNYPQRHPKFSFDIEIWPGQRNIEKIVRQVYKFLHPDALHIESGYNKVMQLIQTPVNRRNYRAAIQAGIIAGIISAIVKFGWEVPLPPRTPERNATNPPQALLELLGFSEHTTHLSYTYNGNSGLPWMSFIVHFGFSIAFALIYCVLAERYPQIKLWQGTAFGIGVYVGFHVILMPAMGIVPAPWNQPWQEHFSELFGHMVWMWVIEIVRRDLRNRITKQPDPEVALA